MHIHEPRINVGGAHVVGYLQQLLQLRYPSLLPHLTPSRALELVKAHSFVALDYGAELRAWGAGEREGQERRMQLPFTPVSAGPRPAARLPLLCCRVCKSFLFSKLTLLCVSPSCPEAVAGSVVGESSSREEREKTRKQRAREQLLRLNTRKREEKVGVLRVANITRH